MLDGLYVYPNIDLYIKGSKAFLLSSKVDFVVRNNEGFTQYIQVSQTVGNKMTLERELAPFDSIADHHEKLLITMDYDTGTYNGIKKINAIDWLTKI